MTIIKLRNFDIVQDFDYGALHISIYQKDASGNYISPVALTKTQEADLEDLIKTFFNEVYVENKNKKDKETS